VWESRGEVQREEGIKYDLANTAWPANACTADLIKAFKKKREQLALPMIIPLNEQKNGQM